MTKDEIIMEENIELQHDDEGLNMDDFDKGNFLKNPELGQTITFKVLKVSDNPNTKGKNKTTEKEFDIGLKYKNGKIRRIDVDTDMGIYTIKNWEIFFKLFDRQKGLLIKYAKDHGKKFEGAVISITRLYNGAHANYSIEDLSRIIGKTVSETKKYQDEIKLAMKEQRLFKVELG